jgi:hypothetical protein
MPVYIAHVVRTDLSRLGGPAKARGDFGALFEAQQAPQQPPDLASAFGKSFFHTTG